MLPRAMRPPVAASGASGRTRWRGRSLRAAAAALIAVAAAGGASFAATPADCLADGVVAFASGFADPNAGFRYAELPGIVLGPPGDSFPTQGSTSTVSLGRGGSITLAFTDNVITDGPGPDFIVFENAFFKGSVPSSPLSSCFVFAEPGRVEASADGYAWIAFPYDAAALALVGQDQTPCSALPSLHGLAGLTPTFTGNWTVPDDPATWDPNGTGGVSGAGGDAFDLATIGLSSARFIRITDLDLGTGFAGNAEGFDLDAVVALHGTPVADARMDSDGDGIADADETALFLSDPFRADTDGDGAPDGAEAAACRSPLTPAAGATYVYLPDLHFPDPSGTSLRWNFASASAWYDLVRGSLGAVSTGSDPVDLGAVTCVEENSFNLTSADHPDPLIPAAEQALFYLLRPRNGGYGPTSDGRERLPGSGDCVP